MAQLNKKYEYVWAYNLNRLSERVTDRLNDGWVIDGKLEHLKEGGNRKLVQPMIKEVEINDEPNKQELWAVYFDNPNYDDRSDVIRLNANNKEAAIDIVKRNYGRHTQINGAVKVKSIEENKE